MNDHKDLIKILREMSKFFVHNEASSIGVPDEMVTSMNAEAVKDAADAIEQLVGDYEILAKMYAKVNEDLCVKTKERDAAVADLKFGRCCTTCLNYKNKNCPPNKCLTDDNDNWEWRGVREDNNATN